MCLVHQHSEKKKKRNRKTKKNRKQKKPKDKKKPCQSAKSWMILWKRHSNWLRVIAAVRMLRSTFLRFRSLDLRRQCSRHIASDRIPVLPSEPVCSIFAYFADSLSCLSRSFRACFSFSLCFSRLVCVLCHVNQQEHVNQREAAWLVKLVKLFVSCTKNDTLPPNPQGGGASRPQTPTCRAPFFAAGYAPVNKVHPNRDFKMQVKMNISR